MNTAMLAAAIGAEEAATAPGPETVVPTLRRLIDERPASGRVGHP
ncbi:hypothetical protein GCM10017673_25460 [Streptosporangium violaceochromogenes]|nr:hypothetical protein GCM10017673_25460 [Streptosporangium violaceochromogenes]